MGLASFNRMRREQELKRQEDKNINDLTVKELKEIAKEKGIEGYNNMKKEDLIAALEGDE